MDTYLTLSISHRVAGLEQLERLSVGTADRERLQRAALVAGCAEALVLSTCSRTEMHVVVARPATGEPTSRSVPRVARRVLDLLAAHAGQEAGSLAEIAAVRTGDDAVVHLFRVAAGLDSRVVGEVEIQAQLRAAARAAIATEGEPHRLRRVVASALTAARSECGHGPGDDRRGLLARRAVAGALAVVGRGTSIDALVVGAGTMGRQVLAALPADRVRATLLSRTPGAAAGAGRRVHPLAELPIRLADADAVFVATSAGGRILPAELVEQALRGRSGRPLVIFDLAVPRNVDPDVVSIPGVHLLDLDDLDDGPGARSTTSGGVIADGARTVEAAARAAAERYTAEIRSRNAGPLITALRAGIEQACLVQLRTTGRSHQLDEESLTRMAHTVAGTVAHRPTVLLRELAAAGDGEALALVAASFDIDGWVSEAVDRALDRLVADPDVGPLEQQGHGGHHQPVLRELPEADRLLVTDGDTEHDHVGRRGDRGGVATQVHA